MFICGLCKRLADNSCVFTDWRQPAWGQTLALVTNTVTLSKFLMLVPQFSYSKIGIIIIVSTL